jgi:DNA-binding HxlR family transcriptional regulator
VLLDFKDTELLDEAIVYKTESQSEPGLWHYTVLTRGGQLQCSCKGWQYTEGCKHTKGFRLDSRGKAILEKWNTLSHNQAYVLTILAKGTATASEHKVWWPLSYNQVRNLLRRLRAAGLVEVTGYRRSAHIYSITEKGRQAIQAHQQLPHQYGAPVWE